MTVFKYPDDFIEVAKERLSSQSNPSLETINEWINKSVEYLNENNDTNCLYMHFDSKILIVVKNVTSDEHGYEVFIAENCYRSYKCNIE